MLKIAATGNLTNDVELRTQEDGRPYAILRIASDRRYRAKDGTRLTDFISIKVRGPLAERCAAFAYKGCKLAAVGDFETVVPSEDPTRQPGFLIKASDVEVLSPRKAREAAGVIDAARANQEATGMPESEAIA
jgi:single-strand DNA-binding protein